MGDFYFERRSGPACRGERRVILDAFDDAAGEGLDWTVARRKWMCLTGCRQVRLRFARAAPPSADGASSVASIVNWSQHTYYRGPCWGSRSQRVRPGSLLVVGVSGV
jgi:hypothetical protein